MNTGKPDLKEIFKDTTLRRIQVSSEPGKEKGREVSTSL